METAAAIPVLLSALTVAHAQELQLALDRAEASWRGAVAIADGAVGGAARFDGDAAHIDCGACAISSRQPFTLRASVRTQHPGFCTLLMARGGDQVGLSLVLGREPGRVSFEAWSWQRVRLLSRTRIDDGRWHRLEVAYDADQNTAILLVDGALEAHGVLGHGEAAAAQLRLGDNIGAHQPFAGDLDEVSLEPRPTHGDWIANVAPIVPPAEAEAALAAWRLRLLPRSTPSLQPERLAEWPQRRAAVRAHVADCLGLQPEPPRGPLDVQVHGELRRDGVVVQRLSWRSFPDTRATGWLWRPETMPKGRVPAVLCPHGHWADGAIDPVVQARCIAFAKFGWLCLGVDSVHVEDVASGVSAIGVMTWNNLRALDWLAARDDVDAARIGATGASGGAQQTYYLMALDDRLAAAAPMVMACYFAEILTDTDSHCGCNHLPRLAASTDVPEMCAVFAPRPALFGSVSGDWTHAFPEQGLPELRALGAHLGDAGWPRSRHAAEGHNYDRPMREVVYGFLHDALVGPAADGRPRATVAEPPLQTFLVKELRALGGPSPDTAPTPAGLAREFLQRRPAIADWRQLAPALPAKVEPAAFRWRAPESTGWRPATVAGADGVPVPFAVRQAGSDGDEPFTVIVSDRGRSALLVEAPAWLSLAKRPVLVDPRGCGEWSPFAGPWRRNGIMLGCGEGYLAAHDVALVCACLPGTAKVTLVGLGDAGVTVLLAAQLCARVTTLVTDDLGRSYADDGNRLPLCPELRRCGDLEQLIEAVAPGRTCHLGGGRQPRLTGGQLGAILASGPR